MNNELVQLEWGRTPFDNLTRKELLRCCQKMFAATEALNTTLKLEHIRLGEPTTGYFGLDGTGGRALEMSSQVLDDVYSKFDRETVFRSFYRYALDLLFDNSKVRIGFAWRVCTVCGVMLGHNEGQEDLISKPCKYPGGDADCKGIYRLLEWSDLQPAHPALPKLNSIIPQPILLPIPMILHCPRCRAQHIDKPDAPDKYCITEKDGECISTDPRCMHQPNPSPRWTNPPHKSHLCAGCGLIWRPAEIPTTGVENIPPGKNDNWKGHVV